MLPTGIVTFLFTDIEGSTRRVERQRDAMARALDRHNVVLTGVMDAHAGHVFKIVGDAFYVAFAGAKSGVSAAIEAQRSLHAEDWSAFGLEQDAIRVRMGLHTGHVQVRDGEYYGPPVNRVARLTAAGHGGQILLSLATQQLIRDDLPPDVELRDLGTHMLRDLQFAERIFLLLAPGLPDVKTLPDTGNVLQRGDSAPASWRALGDEGVAPEDAESRADHSQLLNSVLATKLSAPRLAADSVKRLRLASLLEAGSQRRLVLVSASAGAGKSTALAEWAAISNRPVAWLALDPDDSDIVRFLTYVVAALRAIPESEQLGDAALSLLDSPQLNAQGALTSLMNDIAHRGDAVVLVLDDYHLIDSTAVHESVELLVEHMPDKMTLVIASRSDPPLPIARWRLRGELAELRSDDLSFNTDEAAALLASASGATLAPDSVIALEARTEGWAAGLVAAGLSLRDRDDVDAFVASFTGSHRYVLDYLDEEVVDRQEPEVRGFLLQTSILDRLNGTLCDAVTGQPQGSSTRLLERLERENLFVSPLDDGRSWFRYHQIFSDILRHRLQVRHVAEVPELHRRASIWFEEHGFVEQAVQHAIDAGESERATRLIAEMADAMLLRRDSVRISRWITALGDDVVRSDPRLCIAMAWSTLFGQSLKGAEAWLSRAEHAMEPPRSDDADSLALSGEIASVRARIASWQGDVPATVEWSRAALTDLPEASPLRMEVTMSLAIAHHMGGDVNAAADAFDQAVSLGLRRGNKAFQITSLSMLAEARKLQCRLRDADHLTSEALRLAQRPGGEPYPAASRAYTVLGEIRFEQNRLDEAERCARQAMELGARGGSSVALVTGCMILSLARQAVGDAEGARDALDRLDEEARSYGFEGLRENMAQFRASVELRLGNVAAAARWAEEYELGDKRTASGNVVVARVRLADGDVESVVPLLEPHLASCRATGKRETELHILIVLALTEQARGNLDEALTRLGQAIDLGGSEGFVRVFVTEGRQMAQLLRTARSRNVQSDHCSALLQVISLDPSQEPAPTSAHSQSLLEPMSDRELEVLHLVALGLSNREIADELVIAVGTVKRHLTNINGKLGVNSRTKAVARARELSLID